jgi:hypothetical protein
VRLIAAAAAVIALGSGADALAAGPLAPSSRTVRPVAVLKTTGAVSGAVDLPGGGSARLSGQGASVTLDFGREVGGLVSMRVDAAAGQRVGLAFSESSLNAGPQSDASNGATPDGVIYAGAGAYTAPPASLRGGFRYLTLFEDGGGTVDVGALVLRFTAAPSMRDPSAYPNSFESSDELLNRIWYAGAYTVQMGTIAPDQGRAWPPPAQGWDNSANVGVGDAVLVDGAKRDRTIWPGDLGVAVPTDYVSLDDMPTIRNTLTTLYDHQDPQGALPYAGPAVNFPGASSDTYHLWALIATADYLLYSGDKPWLDRRWADYRRAMLWSTSRIDQNGLLYVTGQADWARSGQGGENIAANALLYRALTTGAGLARMEGDAALAAQYAAQAASVRRAVNGALWDGAAGAYRDNPSSALHPQDGNALAVLFGVVDGAAKTRSILAVLRRNWRERGAHTPEWTGIHPFPGSLEVLARLEGGDDDGALELIRREWGYMLDAPIGTGSTFWEGFNDDGSFAYEGFGAGYTSLAHGWATGPTSALTFYVLGVMPEDGGYRFVPHPGDLRYARGRLSLAEGPLTASWARDGDDFTMRVEAPRGTTGTVGFPATDRTIYVNGAPASGGRSDGRYVYLEGLTGGGAYTITDAAPGCPGCAVTAPSARRCTSRRRLAIHVRVPRRARVRRASLTVDGRPAARPRVRGRRVTAVVDLRGRGAGPARVRIAIRLRSGRVLRVTRTYRTCGRT